jgi:hypothetical protein
MFVHRLGLGAAPGRYPAQLMETYRRMLDDTTIVQGDLRGLPRRRDRGPRP